MVSWAAASAGAPVQAGIRRQKIHRKIDNKIRPDKVAYKLWIPQLTLKHERCFDRGAVATLTAKFKQEARRKIEQN